MFFSIIIPVYNRENLIKRAIDSCLAQTLKEYEIIVVDDASTDDTVDVVLKNYGQKVKLLVNDKNKGVCPTRQKGIDAASGRWIILLDSDNTLFSNALEIMKNQINTLPPDIMSVGFIYKYDTDDFPDSYYDNVAKGIYDWYGFINEAEHDIKLIRNEGPLCFHSNVFRKLRYNYDDLRMNEEEFTFDFMWNFKGYSFGDIVGMYYHDAENRLSTKFDTSLNAPSLLISTRNLLAKYGEELKQHAPKRYKRTCKSLAYYTLISGSRIEKLRIFQYYLKKRPKEYEIIIATILSLVSVKLLILADKLRMKLMQRGYPKKY